MTTQVKGAVMYTFQEEAIAKSVLEGLTEEVLLEKEFKECKEYDSFKVGFTPFVEGDFILKTGELSAVQITTQKKTPKASQVKALCKAKEKEYQEENGLGKLDKETKDTIKTLVVESLLPTTFPDDPVTTVVWFAGSDVYAGVGTYKKAEDLISFIRNTVGSVPVYPLEVQKDPIDELTSMVNKDYRETFTFGNKVVLENTEGGVITFDKESVYDADTTTQTKNGAFVTKINMDFDGAVKFTVNTDLEVSGIKVSKDTLSGSEDIGALIITLSEVMNLFGEVVTVFGGKLGE